MAVQIQQHLITIQVQTQMMAHVYHLSMVVWMILHVTMIQQQIHQMAPVLMQRRIMIVMMFV